MGEDDARFRWFVASTYPRLLRAAYLLTADNGKAEDLLQSALTKTWLAWGRLHHDSAESFVRTTLVRTYISGQRRRWRGELPHAVLPEVAAPDQTDQVAERDRLLRALAALPRQTRAILVLRYFEDMSEAQTAAALGCSVGAVKSQASRGLARLRALGTLGDGRAASTGSPAMTTEVQP
jgi:RNA polymerase sigma-70 factor (ECF subfamily)